MTQPWFRFYRGAVHNPKLQRLPDALFKAWVNLLCCTNDQGELPSLADLAFALRCQEKQVQKWLSALTEARLLSVENGVHRAHDWSDHQKKSDSSADRVRDHRARKAAENGGKPPNGGGGNDTEKRACNVTRNAPDKEQNRTEQTRSEPDKPNTGEVAARDAAPDAFAAVMAASGLAFADHRAITAKADLERWLAAGYDLERIILPTIRELAAVAKAKGQRIASLRYFGTAIAERAAKPASIAAATPVALNRLDQAKFAAAWVRDGSWTLAAPKPGEPGCPIEPDVLQAAEAKHRRAA